MPRLSPGTLWAAWRVSPLVALLLGTCRDIPSARSELRWISEHVSQTTGSSKGPRHQEKVSKLCRSRARGVPLQYILGTQPFGDLEIKCKPGVLIPRPETEAYTLELSRILLQELGASTKLKTGQQKPMRILDICSGTGCISLQLYVQLQQTCPSLQVIGLDISPKAINLSRQNIQHNNIPQLQDQSHDQTISFLRTDILSPSLHSQEDILNLSPTNNPNNHQSKWDLIISNPPYISQSSFSKDTTRSVRNYEPKLALVPEKFTPNFLNTDLVSSCQPEDIFYARILELSHRLKPRRILFEVAGMDQALRVIEMVLSPSSSHDCLRNIYPVVEIWRDDPSHRQHHSEEAIEDEEGRKTVTVEDREIPIRGSGNIRSVYLFTESTKWIDVEQ